MGSCASLHPNVTCPNVVCSQPAAPGVRWRRGQGARSDPRSPLARPPSQAPCRACVRCRPCWATSCSRAGPCWRTGGRVCIRKAHERACIASLPKQPPPPPHPPRPAAVMSARCPSCGIRRRSWRTASAAGRCCEMGSWWRMSRCVPGGCMMHPPPSPPSCWASQPAPRPRRRCPWMGPPPATRRRPALHLHRPAGPAAARPSTGRCPMARSACQTTCPWTPS